MDIHSVPHFDPPWGYIPSTLSMDSPVFLLDPPKNLPHEKWGRDLPTLVGSHGANGVSSKPPRTLPCVQSLFLRRLFVTMPYTTSETTWRTLGEDPQPRASHQRGQEKIHNQIAWIESVERDVQKFRRGNEFANVFETSVILICVVHVCIHFSFKCVQVFLVTF